MRFFAPSVLLATLFSTVLHAQSAAAKSSNACCNSTAVDWPKVGGNYGNQDYSSLTQINPSNIQSLGPAWVIHASAEPVTSPAPGPGTATVGQQTTPVVVDGVLYFETPSGGVMAVDGATGKVKWNWQPSAASGVTPSLTRRGVAVGDGNVYTLGLGFVVALDKETGAQVWAVQPTAKGEALGNTAKAAVVYFDGMIYIGTDDSSRSAGYALRARDGAIQWWFYSAYPHGTSFTDVNGKTFDAGDTWTTKKTPNDTPNECYLAAGGAPWLYPAVDPELGMVYWTFGNARSCVGAQDGSKRPGDNLFANSLVALDAKTGAYKWHFQSVHHDTWDMDNVGAPLLADVTISGQLRKVVYYGSKQGRTFVLDRTNGKPVLPIEERPVAVDSRQLSSPTQPYPLQPSWIPECITYQNLGSEIPGEPNRAVPNYNGYQAEPDPAHPGQLKLVQHPGNYLEVDKPFLSGPERKGCMNEAVWTGPLLSTPSQNGGAAWSNNGFSQKLNMFFIPYATDPSAHAFDLYQGGNGLRALGTYQSGGLVAIDAITNLVKWRKEMGPGEDIAHGNGVLVTATDLLFVARPDGLLLAMDAKTGKELWHFQTGFPSASGVISYSINGEQYIALAAMGSDQPYATLAKGDAVWAFKLGGKAIYTTGPQSHPTVVSGSSEAPAPPPIENLRRPADNAPGTGIPPNTIYLAYQTSAARAAAGRFGRGPGGPPAGFPGAPQTSAPGPGGQGGSDGPGGTPSGAGASGTATAPAAPLPPLKDSTATASMLPSRLTVAVGTTVTFINPGDTQIGGSGTGNVKEHCATQFFEGKFNFRLKPGESAKYTFDHEGEYYYNDCTDPRPTGKVIVTLAAQDAPVQITTDTVDFRSKTGIFTGVTGTVQATMTVPAGWTLDRAVPVTISGGLSKQTFNAVTATVTGTKLVATFNKADIDNNVPVGDQEPLTVSADFITGGIQKKLRGVAHVRVMKDSN